MAARCSPPKGQSVKAHTRSKPRNTRKAAATRAAKAEAKGYYTCVNSSTGRTCGTHHAKWLASSRHAKELNLKSYRAGLGRPWDATRKGGS